MKRRHYSIEIDAAAEKVYDLMLGLTNKKSYEEWTAAFSPTSSYEGSWKKGSKICFTCITEDGRKEGMLSEIMENIVNEFVSVRHYGLVQNGEEITSGPSVEKWAGGLENYSFKESSGKTLVSIEQDLTEEYVAMFDEMWPTVLAKLKEICERT